MGNILFYKNKHLILLFIIGLIFTSPQSRAAKTLRIASNAHYTSFDPMLAYDWLSYQTLTPVCGHLAALSLNNNQISYQLDAASNLELRNNNKTLVFTIPSGKKFHNGNELSAYDVEFSLNRVTNPTLNSPGAAFFENIVGFDDYQNGKQDRLIGVTALDQHTLKINLTHASHSFMFILATNFGCILPKETSMKPIESSFISSGPYKISSYENAILVLKKFEEYDKETRLSAYQEINVFSGISSSDVLAGFANKQFDIILDGIQWASINAQTWKYQDSKEQSKRKNNNPSFSTTYLTMNTKHPPFNDVRVRQAVNFAINRDKLITILSGAATKTTHIPPPAFKEYNELPELYHYAPSKAKKLLDEIKKEPNHVHDKEFQADLYAIDTELYRKLVHSIVFDLQKIGIYITPHFSTHEKILAVASSKKNGEMIFSDGLGWIADYPEISNYFYPLFSKSATKENGWNWSHYSNNEVEKLVVKADSIIDNKHAKERSKLWVKIFTLIEKEAPWAPLYNRRSPNIYSASVLKNIALKSRKTNSDFLSLDFLSIKADKK